MRPNRKRLAGREITLGDRRRAHVSDLEAHGLVQSLSRAFRNVGSNAKRLYLEMRPSLLARGTCPRRNVTL